MYYAFVGLGNLQILPLTVLVNHKFEESFVMPLAVEYVVDSVVKFKTAFNLPDFQARVN